jgi:hypothetical protein
MPADARRCASYGVLYLRLVSGANRRRGIPMPTDAQGCATYGVLYQRLD